MDLGGKWSPALIKLLPPASPPPHTHKTFPQSPELSRVLEKKTKCLPSIFAPHLSQALSDNGDPETTPALQESHSGLECLPETP